MKRPLTRQQQAVYDFIRDRILARGFGPTVREIGVHMNIKSPNGVMCHLRALERKGAISRDANKSRAIELTEPSSRLVRGCLQVAGHVRAGCCQSTAVGSSNEVFDLGQLVAAEATYLLRVDDDCLAGMHIACGDQLIVGQNTSLEVGQIVIATVDEKESRIGTIQRVNGQLLVRPYGATHLSIAADVTSIRGAVIGLLRKYLTTPS